ncbi:PREDICTED: pleckstrin homology domain-containing family M member 2-like [Priapulus caudatus]|uniref:Pleckstrin homology domain-containing family M member 2-like n=1 Tax=Priapulus caudatus TaxID=37621 RepID=A0ABM1DPA0_PRICU|nr:PREDICTED: pleckstrin homology domain-containing family M member 2-like [Priapulus caudatus]
MSTVADRLMLKDRIIENISTSIKQIQELQCIDKEEGDEIVLTNESWQVHRLCEHLDHAFLYGLRHVSKGYWVMLKEFTHKEDLRMILSLPHIATDIGRGRAWMYVVLNENNMESYIRSFMDNRHVLRRHYVKHALLLDEQRMQVLLTLVAGLEFITFSVDPDVPYLDLQASCFISVPRSKRSESCVSCDVEDAVSICSMESEVSQVSGRDVCTAEIPDSDYASLIDSSTHSSLAGKDRLSPRHSPNGVKQDDKVKLADSKEHVTERALHSKEEGIIPDADQANDIIQVIQDNPAVGDHGNHEPSSEQTSDPKQTDVPAPASCDDNPASTREAATRDGAKEASVTRRASQ